MAWAEVATAKTKATPANLIIVTSICTRLADFKISVALALAVATSAEAVSPRAAS